MSIVCFEGPQSLGMTLFEGPRGSGMTLSSVALSYKLFEKYGKRVLCNYKLTPFSNYLLSEPCKKFFEDFESCQKTYEPSYGLGQEVVK